MINWLGFNAILNIFSVISRWPVHLFVCFLTFSHQYFNHTTIFPSNLLLFHMAICGGRMTLVTMNFVKRRKECRPSWGSNSQPLDWQPASLPTELLGLGPFMYNNWIELKRYKEVMAHCIYVPYLEDMAHDIWII